MSLFASIVAFIDTDKSRVERALSDYAERQHGLFQHISADDESEPTIVHESNGNAIIAYGPEVGDEDEITAELSRTLGAIALYLHMHDGDLWLYVLYESGKEVSFNVRPDYWDGPPPSQTMSPSKIYDAIPSCLRDSADKYFCEWTPDLEGQKAYSTDRYEYHNCWQMVDFMAALGLDFPYDDTGQPKGTTCAFIDGDWLRSRLAKLHEIGAPDVTSGITNQDSINLWPEIGNPADNHRMQASGNTSCEVERPPPAA